LLPLLERFDLMIKEAPLFKTVFGII
jgi:hypothetical protein